MPAQDHGPDITAEEVHHETERCGTGEVAEQELAWKADPGAETQPEPGEKHRDAGGLVELGRMKVDTVEAHTGIEAHREGAAAPAAVATAGEEAAQAPHEMHRGKREDQHVEAAQDR